MEFAWDTEESLTEGSDSIGFSFMGYLRGQPTSPMNRRQSALNSRRS